MIYKKLYNIGNKSLNNFIYAARADLTITRYDEWSAVDPFLFSKEEGIKFFSGFDFTPLLDELKKANYVENFLKERLYGTNGIYINSPNKDFYERRMWGRTPKEGISLQAKKILLDILISVFTIIKQPLDPYRRSRSTSSDKMDAFVEFLKWRYWITKEAKDKLKKDIFSDLSSRQRALEIFETRFYIKPLLFLLEFAPMDVLEAILRPLVQQEIIMDDPFSKEIKLSNETKSFVEFILKELGNIYKRIPDNVDKEWLSYADYIKIVNDEKEMKHRKILINKVLTEYFMIQMAKWLKNNVLDYNYYPKDIEKISNELCSFPFFSRKVYKDRFRGLWGSAPFYLGRYLRIIKNYPYKVHKGIWDYYFDYMLKSEFYIYLEKYFHEYFKYLFTSGKVLDSIKDKDDFFYRLIIDFRTPWSRVFKESELPLFILKNTERIVTFLVRDSKGALWADLCHLPAFLLPPILKKKYPNLVDSAYMNFKKLIEKVSAYEILTWFPNSWYPLIRENSEKISSYINNQNNTTC